MPPAVPLKQVTKFFILESSRKSCRQKGQWTVSPGKQEPSGVSLFLLSCIPCSRGMWKGPADLAHAYLQVSSAAPPFPPLLKPA